jgi:hypothetical protein
MGFFDSINDTIQLTKSTFVVIGKNRAILRPTISQIIVALVLYLLTIISLILLIFASATIKTLAILLLVIFLVLLIPLFPFIKIYYRAAQCWIVYKTFTGKECSYQEGIERARKNKGDVFLIGLFDIILTALARKLKEGSGRKGGLWMFLNILMWLAGKTVEEGWDLIGHYLLPASIIQEKHVGQVLPEIKNIKNNVPGALAGVFGFDFVGDLIGGYLFAVSFLFIMIGVIIGVILNVWIPLLVIIALLIAIIIGLKILVDMVKTVYFTLFYIAITMPMKIPQKYRKEVTNYLKYQAASQSSKPKETREQKITKLLPHIKRYRKQGYSNAKIQSFLIKNGWPESVIKEALKRS